jgi:hypothetical protein
MKLAGLLIVVALVPSWGQPLNKRSTTRTTLSQIQIKQQPATAVAAKPATNLVAGGASAVVPLQMIAGVETDLDRRISATGGADPCVVRGFNRGVYVSGFGAVFTSEVDLANAVGLGPFKSTITPQEKEQTHKRKMAHVPQLEQSMRDMVRATAAALKDLPENEQIVVAVRLIYHNWEDTTGLPGQIIMRMDRKGGDVRMELQ